MADKPVPPRLLAAQLALAVCSIVVVDVSIGLMFCRDGRFLGRVLPPYPLLFTELQEGRMQTADHERRYIAFDPDLGWAIRPETESPDSLYRSNAAGFRASREHTREPPAGVTRIAAFGDSFTHGAEVPFASTWTAQLAAMRSDVEVLNFGVNAYGTDQAFLRYRRDGRAFRPHIVLVGLMVENILRNVSVYRPAYNRLTGAPAVKPRFRLGPSGAIELLPCPVATARDLKEAVESRRLLTVLHDTDYWVARSPMGWRGSPVFVSSLARLAYAVYDDATRPPLSWYYRRPDNEPFRLSAAIVRRFHDEALADGASLVVLMLPSLGALEERRDAGRPFWSTMVDELESHGIRVIDVGAEFARAVPPERLAELFVTSHYSEEGNRLVAEAIGGALFPR
jgi:hypothetical protein